MMELADGLLDERSNHLPDLFDEVENGDIRLLGTPDNTLDKFTSDLSSDFPVFLFGLLVDGLGVVE